jgi:hypothetical protein
MLYLPVDMRQQARYLPNRCEHDGVAASVSDFVKDGCLLSRGVIAWHLRLCPNEPATIAAEQVRYSYLLETICTSLNLEGSATANYHDFAGIRHKLPFGLTCHHEMITKVGGCPTA